MLVCCSLIVSTAVACADITSTTTTSPIDSGARLYRSLGCNSCHSINGRESVGPTWRGLAGSMVTLEDGSVVVADGVYLARSIRDPVAQRVAGFSTLMPALNLSDAELAALVAYIESLGLDASDASKSSIWPESGAVARRPIDARPVLPTG